MCLVTAALRATSASPVATHLPLHHPATRSLRSRWTLEAGASEVRHSRCFRRAIYAALLAASTSSDNRRVSLSAHARSPLPSSLQAATALWAPATCFPVRPAASVTQRVRKTLLHASLVLPAASARAAATPIRLASAPQATSGELADRFDAPVTASVGCVVSGSLYPIRLFLCTNCMSLAALAEASRALRIRRRPAPTPAQGASTTLSVRQARISRRKRSPAAYLARLAGTVPRPA